MTTQDQLDRLVPSAPRVVRSGRLALMLGDLLLLTGVYLLFYVGGLYATEEYYRVAARGDNDIPLLVAPTAPIALATPSTLLIVVPAPAPAFTPDRPVPAEKLEEPAPVQVLVPASAGEPVSDVPTASIPVPSTVSRIVIPSINVDSKVIEVGWTVEEQNGRQVAVWGVAKYAVGHHRSSANPGTEGNIVLAGHVGGYGRVFRDLYYVQPGDQIILYSANRQLVYVVEERLIVTEEGVSAEQRTENARYISPYPYEVVTLITCWPASGPDKFTQRVIVRARPPQAGEELFRMNQ